MAEENLAKAEQKHIDTNCRLQVQQRLRRDDQDREKRHREIVKLLHDNRVKEAELLKAMKETEEKKVFASFLFSKWSWQKCNHLFPVTGSAES